MAQQILNVSTPNSGLGDALRDASIKSNDNFTELYDGKVDKVTGKDLSDNNLTDELVTKINDLEASAQVNIQSDWNENDIEADAYIKNKPEQLFASLGYFDYADLATQTTPITVASGVQTLLTNDALGDATNTSQPPYGVTAIWDADSDEFNFQQLSVGDTVDIRVHLKTTTTSANQKYHIDMKFAFDGPSEFENRIFSQYVKTAGEDEQSFVTTLYIGSESVRTYPARLYITSDDDATVKVVGWFCRVFRKSVNIVDIITDEAPIDGLTYGRKDAGWVEVSGSSGGIPDAPNNANAYVRSALSWVVGYTKTAVDALLGNKVDANAPITGTVKTKITYDSKGLVIAGADALTSDIADSPNRRYVTDAQLTIIGNTSGTNTGDNATNSQYSGLATSKQDVLTDVNFGTFSTALTSKTTPVDADTVNLSDSADSNKARKLSFANLKAWILSLINTTISSETGVYYFNDFFGSMSAAADGFISSRATGLNSNVNFTTGTIPNHQVNQSGVAQLKTGTTATGVAGIHLGETIYQSSLVVGGGVISYKTSINIETLSTALERFWVGVGYKDGLFLNLGIANAICFIYDEGGVITGNTASPNWKIVTCNSSVRTFTDTGVAVSGGAWVKLEILINAAATSVEFFINNVSVGTISTNIPSGTSKLMIINNQILKTIGTTSRNLYMDYVAYKQTFTTPRI